MAVNTIKRLLYAMDEEVAYATGYTLRGVNIVFKGGSVMLVLKLTGRLDGPKVAFIEGHTLEECWQLLGRWLYGNDVKLKLHPDKFA